MKILNTILLGAFTVLLIYTTFHLPARGKPDAPMHAEASATGAEAAGAYYVKNAYLDAATPNMVTVVLGDYRSFDTLGEVLVVLTAGMACYLILRGRNA